MRTAAELRKSLVELELSDEQIEAIVKGQLEAGAVTEAGTGGISLDDVEAVAEELRKGLELEPPVVEPIEKGDEMTDENDMIDVLGTLEHFAKAADGMVQRQEAFNTYAADKTEVLMKAWLAGSRVQEQLVKAQSAQNELIKGLVSKIDAIATQLGTPLPPRSVTGNAEPIPTPAESMAKGVGTYDKVMGELQNRLQKASDPQEQRALFEAVAKIESGVNPEMIAKSYNIALA